MGSPCISAGCGEARGRLGRVAACNCCRAMWNLRSSLCVIVVAGLMACGHAVIAADGSLTPVEIKPSDVGMPPADFEPALWGEGEPGRWTVVRDQTANDGIAIEHVSTDPHEDRFPLAIYQLLRLENSEIDVRFKIVSGTMQSAGVAVCLRNPGSFYAIIASALEHRVDLILFHNDKIERIGSAEAEVTADRWHDLKVVVNDDHFIASLDQKKLFTTFDRTRMKDGRFALLTQEDNVTRFERIRIRPLPNSYNPQ